MTVTWTDEAELEPERLTPLGWVLVILRGIPFILVLIIGLALHEIIRVIERPFAGQTRPVSPKITQFVCRIGLVFLGIKMRVHGEIMEHPGAVVANHSSWLDIFVLNARKRIYFVAKSEVKGWAGIGWLARTTGTVFINRDRREAKKHTDVLKERLGYGHRLLFFPEGTSTDNKRVLPFKTTLFAPFLTEGIRENAHIQPVSVVYHAPVGKDPRFYGWWGDMEFASHILQVLGSRKKGSVDVICHPAIRMADHSDRKKLALELETQVRAGYDQYTALER